MINQASCDYVDFIKKLLTKYFLLEENISNSITTNLPIDYARDKSLLQTILLLFPSEKLIPFKYIDYQDDL